jgi:major membrane immunogen (membrane-anchored lipoprotein)
MTIPLAWFCLSQRKSGRVRLAAIPAGMIALLLLLSSCGGSGGPPSRVPGTPQGTYDVVIKATASDFEAKAIVKVTLQ